MKKNKEIQKFIQLCRDYRCYLGIIEKLTKENYTAAQIEYYIKWKL